MSHENNNTKRIVEHLRKKKFSSFDLNNLVSNNDSGLFNTLPTLDGDIHGGLGTTVARVCDWEMGDDDVVYSRENVLNAVEKYDSKKKDMGFRSIESLIEEITLHTKRKEFVDRVVAVYEDYKYRTFYTKGIIYDSIDRKLSSKVIISMLSGDYECVEFNTTSIKVVILDRYMTTIRMKMEDGDLHVDVCAKDILTPKLNKQAMKILATVIFNKLCN